MDEKLYHFLRDDPYNKESIVTGEEFWGSGKNDGLYLDYHTIENRSIVVSDGIKFDNQIYTFIGNDCDQWIDRNFIHGEKNSVYVIQGYAGCGKTIFVNSLFRNDSNTRIFNISDDFRYDNEPYLLFDEMINVLDIFLQKLEEDKDIREKVLERFFSFVRTNNLRRFSLEVSNFAPQIGHILGDKWKDNFRNELLNHIQENYSEKNIIKANKHNRGQLSFLISLIISLFAAKIDLTKENDPSYTFVLDNLDIITDPTIVSEFIVIVWNILEKYDEFCRLNYNSHLPKVKFIITVRKILFSHISSYLPDMEMSVSLNENFLHVCDISNLYFSQNIVKHRIEYWSKSITDEKIAEQINTVKYILSATNDEKPESFISNDSNELIEPVKMINLDAFTNHNYRTFSAQLSFFSSEEQYESIFYCSDIYTEKWQITASLILALSILHKRIDGKNVWGEMGFDCCGFGRVDYPTTFSRLILNYLYYYRVHNSTVNGLQTANADAVTLNDLISVFEKIKIKNIKREDILEDKHEESESNSTVNLLLLRLAEMCARNPYWRNAYGYNKNDYELWRRPVYFRSGVKLSHTATNVDDLVKCFENAVRENGGTDIYFSITDEGCILLKNIVNSFEFYSARFGSNNRLRPLYQAESSDEVNSLISPVYDALQKCCNNNTVFMEDYLKANMDSDISKYLEERFHPRTNFKYDAYGLLLKNPRPQLHIVRVIYSHIGYFDLIKDFVSKSDIAGKNKICECLTSWIGEYLDLYKCFEKIVEKAYDSSDNKIYKNLSYWYDVQKDEYRKGSHRNIRIRNINHDEQLT